MIIHKELHFIKSPYIAQVTLENGVILNVREDGSADGSDGLTYYNISEDRDDNLRTIGWSSDTDKPTIL